MSHEKHQECFDALKECALKKSDIVEDINIKKVHHY
jgi:hypothetical protein